MHLDGVARPEIGEVFAQLRFMQLTNNRIHFLYSLQTHSGGASTSETNTNYKQSATICLEILSHGLAGERPTHLQHEAAQAASLLRQTAPFLRVAG
jgi:hypothetical protein